MGQHLGQVQGVKSNFATTQTDTILVACPNGRNLYIWNVIVDSGSGSETLIKLGSSPNTEICTVPESCSMGVTCVNILGGQDEDILITCPADTTVRIQYTLE
jgi:hypothetical protein